MPTIVPNYLHKTCRNKHSCSVWFCLRSKLKSPIKSRLTAWALHLKIRQCFPNKTLLNRRWNDSLIYFSVINSQNFDGSCLLQLILLWNLDCSNFTSFMSYLCSDIFRILTEYFDEHSMFFSIPNFDSVGKNISNRWNLWLFTWESEADRFNYWLSCWYWKLDMWMSYHLSTYLCALQTPVLSHHFWWSTRYYRWWLMTTHRRSWVSTSLMMVGLN